MSRIVRRCARVAAFVAALGLPSAAGAACRWSVQSPASEGASVNELSGIWADSANDVWAWGERDDGTELAHYDGERWRQIDTVRTFGSTAYIESVRGTGPRDVWAAGYARSGFVLLPYIAHWNGRAWATVPSPPLPADELSRVVYGVAAAARDDAYAVGSTCDATRCTGLLEHYDGTRWALEPGYASSESTELMSVAMSSPTDAWAAGSAAVGLIERLDAATGTWHRVPSEPQLGVVSLSARAASEAWAVGNPGTEPEQPVQRWNGRAWAVIPFSPNLGLTAVDATGAAVWIVGSDISTGLPRPVAFRAGSRGWQDLAPAAAPPGTAFNAVAVVPGDRDVWVAGYSGYPRTLNLAARYQCFERTARLSPAS